MVKKLTVEEVVRNMTKVHEGRYKYNVKSYSRNTDKIEIICEEHGVFYQSYASHVNGHGCAKCGFSLLSRTKAFTTEDFIEKAEKVHGVGKYNYSKVKYVTALKDVTIVCHSHGDFLQRPAHHFDGHGCPKCSTEINTDKLRLGREQFIAIANRVHNYKYDYSLVEYYNYSTKVTVICKDHGSWSISPHNHLKGSGCFYCKKDKQDLHTKDHTLYVLTHNNVTKVGLTCRDVQDRIYQINTNSGKNFNLLAEYNFLERNSCFKIETELLQLLRKSYYSVKEVYDGSSECFEDVNLAWLLNTIESKLRGINE
jgi:hypothetical protein